MKKTFTLYKETLSSFFICLLFLSYAKAQTLISNPSNNQNYILTSVPRVSGNTNVNNIYSNNPSINTVAQTVQYTDGLGRPIQSVQIMGSPSYKDVIQPVAYDSFGRVAITYKPYALTGAAANGGSYQITAVTDQGKFYNSSATPAGITTTAFPFSRTNFEQSPLNRVIEQGKPGDNWQPLGTAGTTNPGHTDKVAYSSNNATTWVSDSVNSRLVIMYSVTISATTANNITTITRTLSVNGSYGAGQLTVTVSKDENWKLGRAGTVEEYKDKNGRVVLKRVYNYVNNILQQLSTYYVYDDAGNLSFVLTPISNADNVTPAQTTLDSYCYQYQYDSRYRQIGKKLPGKGWEYTVYNSLDQMVGTQDANQRNNNQWIITKYDALGRAVVSGVWNNNNTSITQQALQYAVKNQTTSLWETRDYTNNLTVNPTGYVINSYPNSGIIALSINYYDDYNYPNLPAGYSYQQMSASQPPTASTNTRGLLTATKTTVLNTLNNSIPDMLSTVNYYDDLGRLTQVYSQHYLGGILNINNYDQITNIYNFTNQITSTIRRHFNTSSTTTPILTVNNTYSYDQIGRKTQSFEQINGGTNIMLNQVVYNELGQPILKQLHSENGGSSFLQAINYTYNERDWLTQSSAPLFAMQLLYNAAASPQYNGNISSQLWGLPGSLNKSYTYAYDKTNRLIAGVSSEGFNEQGLTYDLMGNILTLNRLAPSQSATNYTYNYNGNQLQNITGLTTTNYGYDLNGNMNYDARNKNNIQYNLANLPQVISGNASITYVYDAAGMKLRRISPNTGTTDYIGGIEYDNGAISFIETEDGKAVIPAGVASYEYYLSDNLGNTRITFAKVNNVATIVQQDDYYPFGKEISRLVNGTKNEYLYNGKELQEETGELDYSHRFYDPIIGRFTTIDPMADRSRRFSTFAYCENNPIRNIDPDGMITVKGGYGEDEDVSQFDTTTPTDYLTYNYSGKTYGSLRSFFSNNLDVAAAYNIETGEDLGISPFWSYMNKSDLISFTRSINPGLGGGGLQNTAGGIFEKTFNNFMTQFNDKGGYIANTKYFKTSVNGRNGVVPDGITAAAVVLTDEAGLPLDGTLIPRTSWYEVKATASTISGSSFGNQAIGLVDALYISNPVAAQEGYSSLTFVTTADATISASFVSQAKSQYNINIWQFRALYRKTDSGIKVSFYDPDNASMFFRWNQTRSSVYLSH